MLALDDAHWLDEPTLRLARFLLGRLHALPLAIVLALRTDEPGAGEDGALRAILAHPATRVLAPAPLSDAAVEQLVQSVTGGRSSRRFCRRCAEVTGGNPFYVQELTAFVAGHQPDTTAPELLDDVAPPSIRRAVLSRLGRLGAGARAVARATAVLGEDARPHLVALLAQLTVDDVLLEADRLSTASLVTVGVTLRFRHPLIRAVVADDVQDGRRSAGHVRAAQALHDEGARRPSASPATCCTRRPRSSRTPSGSGRAPRRARSPGARPRRPPAIWSARCWSRWTRPRAPACAPRWPRPPSRPARRARSTTCARPRWTSTRPPSAPGST